MNENAPSPEITTIPLAKKIPKWMALNLLFVFLVILMAFLKMPETRITSYLQGMVQSALDPYGLYVSDHGRELSILRGLTYSLDHPSLELADLTRIEFDDLTVSPKLLMLLGGKMGVSARLHQGPAEISLDAGGRGDKVDVTLNLENADIGKLGILAFAAGIKGSGLVTGNLHLEGSLSEPASLNGGADLKLKKLHLDEQTLVGFALPALNISEGTIILEIKSGKALMKSVQIGKATDDLRLNVTGDLGLNRNLNSSTLNLRAVFGFSDKLKQSLSILESLLSAGKLPDGRYAYKLTGSLGAPFPQPDPEK